MSQMKEQNKTPEKELNKMEINNLLSTEFRTLVIRMLSELRKRVDEISENFNKETGNIKIDIENIKKDWSEMKNTLQGITSRVDEAEDQMRDLEDTKGDNT